MNIDSKRKKHLLMLLSIVVVLILFLLSINLGSIKLEISELLKGLLFNSNDPKINIIRDIRIPRVLAAIIIGGNLAVPLILPNYHLL